MVGRRDEKDRKDQSVKRSTQSPNNRPAKPLVTSGSLVSQVRSQQPGFIPPHGGYQNLLSYQKAQIVYDATVYFCDRFLERRDRTYDQMIQAALRQAKHRGGQSGFGYVERNGNQVDQRGPC